MKVYLICGIKILIELGICFLVIKCQNIKMIKLIFLFGSTYILYKMIKLAFKYSQKEYQTKIFKEKENLLYHYYNLMKENNEKLVKIKHDIKNQLQVAYVIFEQDRKQAIKLLDEIEENLKDIHQVNYCKNPILNTIIAIKIAEAQKHHIIVEIDIDQSICLDMEEIDICNLFSNLLDNSIEASQKVENRYIKLSVYKKLEYIIIKCENTYNCMVKKDKYGNFKSTKAEYKKHGYGMKIIESTVEKYKGELNIQMKDRRFMVMIIFCKKEQKNIKTK